LPRKAEPGVVYTKSWVVELILDLAGYTPDKPLANRVALEPSAGDGAFLIGMARRLIESCKRHKMSWATAKEALRAYDINPSAVSATIAGIRVELVRLGVDVETASQLAHGRIQNGDFLEVSLGFPIADYVLGNPPYIRLEEIPEGKAAFYRSSYDTMRGRSDLYIAFYQAALAQLRPGGVCAFICADRWLRNGYGAALRKFITSDYSVRYIIETHNVDAFESEVSAYPAITVISREPQREVVVARALPGIEQAENAYIISHVRSGRSNTVVHATRFSGWFKGGEPWTCSSPDTLSALKDLEDRFEPLESSRTGTKVSIGVATGADDVFISNKPQDIESDRLMPIAMACDLQEPYVKWSGHYLANPWDQSGLVDLNEYPRLEKYLATFRSQLQGRHVAKKRPTAWYRTIDRVNLPLFSQSKLYIADIQDHLVPALDEGKTYPHHNLYWITSQKWDLRVLGALLMSEVGEFFIRCYGVRMRGGYFRFQAQYLRRIRVPDPDSIKKDVAEKLVRAFENRDLSLANELALKLYGISTLPKPN
jgi:adenine-specific DNA-methyltransferase